MCGIVGFISRKGSNVTPRLVPSLQRLRHRGMASAGVAVIDKEGFLINFKELGSPTLVFKNFPWEEFESWMGIGHTRYTTAGKISDSALKRNAQPLVVDGYAIVENGDLLNAYEVREWLRRRGIIFNSESDGEVMLRLFLYYLRLKKIRINESPRAYAKKVFRSLRQANRRLNGGWSVIIQSPRGLIVWRDPHGIRPLCLAKHRDENGQIDEIALASESTVFNYWG